MGSAAADLESAEILVPVTFGHLRARLHPEAKSIQIRTLIARSRIRSIRRCRPLQAGGPNARPAASAAEDHSAQLIAQGLAASGSCSLRKRSARAKTAAVFTSRHRFGSRSPTCDSCSAFDSLPCYPPAWPTERQTHAPANCLLSHLTAPPSRGREGAVVWNRENHLAVRVLAP